MIMKKMIDEIESTF